MAKVLIVEDDELIAKGMASHLPKPASTPTGSAMESPASPACASNARTSASSTSCFLDSTAGR